MSSIPASKPESVQTGKTSAVDCETSNAVAIKSRNTVGSEKYAAREECFRPSPVRAVFETAMRPDVVSLAGGNPDLSFLPHEFIREVAAQAITDVDADVLQYGSGAGTDGLRALCATLMSWGGLTTELDNVQITSGSQAGLDAVTKLLCDPGDVIIAEGPTYVGALGTFGAYEVEVRHVELDAQGLDPDRVAEVIDEALAAGKRVRYLYTIAAHSNPAGISLAHARRERLIEVCAHRGVWIVEDDAYGLINFPGNDDISVQTEAVSPAGGAQPLPRQRTLAALAPEHVIHLGSLSKVFSPGCRVGWIVAPKQIRNRLQIACESVCITPSVVSQYLAEHYVGTPLWRKTLQQQCAVYQHRSQVIAAAIREYLSSEIEFTDPRGGFFTWLTLPLRERPYGDLLAQSIAHQVVIVPGSGCYEGAEPGTHVRMAFSAVADDVLCEGVRRFARALS